MPRLTKLPLLLAASATLLTASVAAASPTVRDHGTTPPPAAPDRGKVRDHRTDPGPQPTRHRRHRGPRVMMPLKLDLGAQGASTSRGFLPGLELRAGIHWASLSPQPTDLDIGLGVFGAVLAGPRDDAMPDANNDVLYGGAYLEVGQTLSRTDHTRTWASGRAEYFGVDAFGETKAGFGVAGRLSAELYASGVGLEPRGIFLGTYAIGVYAEAGLRDLGSDVGAFQISAGLTIRTPLVLR